MLISRPEALHFPPFRIAERLNYSASKVFALITVTNRELVQLKCFVQFNRTVTREANIYLYINEKLDYTIEKII